MALAVVHSRAQTGVVAPAVTVEVHLASGLPSLSVVGLPEGAVKESKDRVRAALLNCQFEFPSRRITVNLAPADLPKEGGRFDLPIALGILAASGQISAQQLSAYECVGELALGGELRPVRGILPTVLAARAADRTAILPAANGAEGALVDDAQILAADDLLAVCGHLSGAEPLSPPPPPDPALRSGDLDLADVRGQHHAKRALEITGAGGHSLLMIGPPGSGKTMLASRLPSLLPLLTATEALEAAAVASVSDGGVELSRWRQRPFRTPHHTASGVALVGGGSQPRPGEISLAHRGVLFLDELPEFDRRVLEVLREPLESGRVVISRAARQAEFPAQFQLIAAMNPCPCGHLGDGSDRCHCTPEQISRYRSRVSGPLLDRIDLHLEVPRSPPRANAPAGESSAQVRSRVEAAQQRQRDRQGVLNHALSEAELAQVCTLQDTDRQLLEQAADQLGLSARGFHRILKVARTIADLEGAAQLTRNHLTEAITYRRLDRGLATGAPLTNVVADDRAHDAEP